MLQTVISSFDALADVEGLTKRLTEPFLRSSGSLPRLPPLTLPVVYPIVTAVRIALCVAISCRFLPAWLMKLFVGLFARVRGLALSFYLPSECCCCCLS